MPSEWRTTRFQQLIDEDVLEIGDGYRAQNSELGGNGPIFLRAGHVTDSHIDFSGVEHFHEHLFEKVRPKMSRVGDTIITTKGNSTGRTSFVTPRMPPFVYSPHLSYWRSRDLDRLDSGFLRYWACGREFSEQLSGMKASTDMAPYLSLTDQRRLKITVPPIGHQRLIAETLGALDDKIELNRRMNATLEAMARALFQSWFVDFDPVRAKLDGRHPPGLDPETAALFPDSFQDSDLGRIPRGWRTGPLSELATVGKASLNPGLCPGEQFDHYSLPAFDDGRKPKVELGAAIRSNKFAVPQGAVLLSKLNPHIPRVWFPAKLHGSRPSVCSTEFIVVEPATSASSEFLYSLFTSQPFSTAYASLVTGTTGSHQRVRPEDAFALPCLIPPTALAHAFTDRVSPLLAMAESRAAEGHLLAGQREALLPELLGGRAFFEE